MLWSKISLRRLKLSWKESLLLIIATALGVAVLLAIFYAADASISSFSETASMFGSKDIQRIRKTSSSTFSEQEASELLPYIDPEIVVIPTLEASGLLRQTAVNFYGLDYSILKSSNYSDAFISENFAKRLKIKSGDLVEVEIFDRKRNIKIETLKDWKFVENSVLMPIYDLQIFTEQSGRISSFVIPTNKKIKLDLGQDWVVEDSSSIAKSSKLLLGAFRTNIFILVGLTILVCAFIVFNSAQIRAVRRSSELSLLRTLGATRVQIFNMLIAELIITGALGSLIGLTLGYPISILISKAFFGTVSTIYLGAADFKTLGVSSFWHLYILAWCGGVVITIVGGLVPFWIASNSPPSVLLRQKSSSANFYSQYYFLFAALMFVSLFSFYYMAVKNSSALFSYLSSLSAVMLISTLAPLALDQLSSLIKKYSRSLSTFLATAHILAFRNSLALTVIAGSIAVSILVSMSSFIGSFQTTLSKWSAHTFQADIFIKPSFAGNSRIPNRISEKAVEIIKSSAQNIAFNASIETEYQNKKLTIFGTNARIAKDKNTLELLSGNFDLDRILAGKDILVSESFQRKFKLAAGDNFSILGSDFKIAGVYKEFTKEHGYIWTDLTVLQQKFEQINIESASIYTAPDLVVQDLRNQLARNLKDYDLQILLNQELKARVDEIFDQTFEVTKLIRVIVIILAILGFILCTIQQIYQKAETFRVLKVMGLNNKEMLLVMAKEGLIVGVISSILGCVLGLLLAWIIVVLINPNAFGWSLEFVLKPSDISFSGLLIVLAYLIGSMIPAMKIDEITAKAKLNYE